MRRELTFGREERDEPLIATQLFGGRNMAISGWMRAASAALLVASILGATAHADVAPIPRPGTKFIDFTVEIVGLRDLDNAAKLLAEFCLSVTADANWIP